MGVSQGALWGLSESSAGSLQDFPRFSGCSDPMLVTLRNCWGSNSWNPVDLV